MTFERMNVFLALTFVLRDRATHSHSRKSWAKSMWSARSERKPSVFITNTFCLHVNPLSQTESERFKRVALALINCKKENTVRMKRSTKLCGSLKSKAFNLHHRNAYRLKNKTSSWKFSHQPSFVEILVLSLNKLFRLTPIIVCILGCLFVSRLMHSTPSYFHRNNLNFKVDFDDLWVYNWLAPTNVHNLSQFPN